MKKIICILVLSALMLVCLASCSDKNYDATAEYEKAIDFIEEGKYEEAYSIFKKLEDSEMCAKFYYVPSHIEYTSGNNKISYDFYYNENNILSQTIKVEDSSTDSNDRKTVDDYEYDENGNLIKCILTNYKEEKGVYDYTYDENGNLVKKISVLTNGNMETVEYTYDDNGRLVKEYAISRITVEYKYDEKGNLIEKINTYLPDDSESINRYTYDENGNLIKDVYTSYGINKHIIDYTYDANGNLIKKVFIHSDGMEYINEYIYDSKGNLIKDVYYTSDDQRYVTDYTYDENNNIIKSIYRGSYTCVEEWTYDENGNLINYVNTNNDKIIETTKYSYKLVYISYDWDEISDATKEMLAEKLCIRLENLG